MLQKRESIFKKAYHYINNYLDPCKSLCSSKTWALSVSSDSDYQIHLKRNPDSCFVNNYNPAMLKSLQANLDLQPVHNYYKALSYMA